MLLIGMTFTWFYLKKHSSPLLTSVLEELWPSDQKALRVNLHSQVGDLRPTSGEWGGVGCVSRGRLSPTPL